MDWKLYKEGQGKWARNSVATAIALFGVYLAYTLYQNLVDPFIEFEIRNSIFERFLGVSRWPFDYRFVIVAPVLIAVLWFGVKQYNKPRWANFLIDTENELRNRVTWPSRKEELNASLVVVVAVIIIGAYTFLADFVLAIARDWVYL